MPLTGYFFCDKPCDSSSSTSHVYNRQYRIGGAYCKGCERALNQRTIDFSIQRMGRKWLKVELVCFFCFKQPHNGYLPSEQQHQRVRENLCLLCFVILDAVKSIKKRT